MLNLPPLDELQLATRFDEIRRQLADSRFEPLYNKNLAFWALPSDRRLPLALMNRTLKQIISSSFTDLAATPGIGKKKLQGLLLLLERAVNTDPSSIPEHLASPEPLEVNTENKESDMSFRWEDVSELTWAEWRATVVRHRLQNVPLGRLAPSLKKITRVIWHAPLGDFVDMTIAELREKRSFGDRRLAAVLEVFSYIHDALKGISPQSHLVMELAPRRIHQMQQWILDTWQSARVPTEEEIREHFIHPLLEQARVDTVDQTVDLVEKRLGIHEPPVTVRHLGRMFNLTRARIYQLFDELAEIMQVRWPLGRALTQILQSFIVLEYNRRGTGPNISQLSMAIEIFFPRPGERRQIVAGKGGLPDLSPGFAMAMSEENAVRVPDEEEQSNW